MVAISVFYINISILNDRVAIDFITTRWIVYLKNNNYHF